MTYDPNASRKGGSRKHLIEEVIKQVDAEKNGKTMILAFNDIAAAVRRYQKEMGKVDRSHPAKEEIHDLEMNRFKL